MRIKPAIGIFLLSAALLVAAAPTDHLNSELFEIVEALQSNDDQIIGSEYTADLRLKIGNEKFLIFSDAYLKSEKTESKYQIAKWIFTPEQTESLEGKMGSLYRVRFKVEELKTDPPYADMPHVMATILSINPLDS